MILVTTSIEPIEMAIINCPVTRNEITIVSKVPTILQEMDFIKLLKLESLPFEVTNHFWMGRSRIMPLGCNVNTKVCKVYKYYRVIR